MNRTGFDVGVNDSFDSGVNDSFDSYVTLIGKPN